MKYITSILTLILIALPVQAGDKNQAITNCKLEARALIGEGTPIKFHRFKGRRDRIIELRIGNGKGFDRYDCVVDGDSITIASTKTGAPLAERTAALTEG